MPIRIVKGETEALPAGVRSVSELREYYDGLLAGAVEAGGPVSVPLFREPEQAGLSARDVYDAAAGAARDLARDTDLPVTLVAGDERQVPLSGELMRRVREFLEVRTGKLRTGWTRRLRDYSPYVKEEKEYFTSIESDGELPFSAPAAKPKGKGKPASMPMPDLMPVGAPCMAADFDPKRDFLPEESFAEAVLRLIDEKGLTDPQCYSRANLSRAVFNKLKQSALNPDAPEYRPSKPTALALAVGLGLSRKEADELLKKAGFALSGSSRSDLIVEYFLMHENYDIFELNEVLFRFGQQPLGSF